MNEEYRRDLDRMLMAYKGLIERALLVYEGKAGHYDMETAALGVQTAGDYHRDFEEFVFMLDDLEAVNYMTGELLVMHENFQRRLALLSVPEAGRLKELLAKSFASMSISA